MNLGQLLLEPFAWHALLGGGLVAVICGLIGPFVIARSMAFAVHGTSELAFTGAAAGLLLGIGPIAGALGGALIVAAAIGAMGVRERERDSSIGVILAFGLGVGVLLLSFYHGFATQATNILFGNLFGISVGQMEALIAIGIGVILTLTWLYRPLLFASVDPEVAEARGVPIRTLSITFLVILAFTVTAAAQVVGTLLVLSLAITPATAARRLSARPAVVTSLSVVFAIVAALGGILASLWAGTVKPSVFITFISFAIYLLARIWGRSGSRQG